MTPGPYDPSGPWGEDATGESLGAMLTRVRQERGKSQLRLAELLCAASGLATVTRHEISRWEREERITTGRWLRWLAVVLDAPLDEFERAAAVARARRAGRSYLGGAAGPATDRPTAALPEAAEPGVPHRRIAELRLIADLVSGVATEVWCSPGMAKALPKERKSRTTGGHLAGSVMTDPARSVLVADASRVFGVRFDACPAASSTSATSRRTLRRAG